MQLPMILFFFKCLYLLILKVDNIKKEKEISLIELFSYCFFSVVSMVVKRLAFPENDHFSLNLYISTSIRHIFSSNIFLELPLCENH